MPRKKKSPPLALFQPSQMILPSDRLPFENDSVSTLPSGIDDFLNYLNENPSKRSDEMYCLIMYDIENNKVRRNIAKYLERKGCIRVQKSIFFAKLHRNLYRDVTNTLREIQEAYENQDSIMLVPVGEDMLNNFVLIGRHMEFELMTHTSHTLFF